MPVLLRITHWPKSGLPVSPPFSALVPPLPPRPPQTDACRMRGRASATSYMQLRPKCLYGVQVNEIKQDGRLATENTDEALGEAENNEEFLERSSEEGLTKPRSYIVV